MAAEAHESKKLGRLRRRIARPAISGRRLSIALQGRVRQQLKTAWRNGTPHVEWDPVGVIAKLAALTKQHWHAARPATFGVGYWRCT